MSHLLKDPELAVQLNCSKTTIRQSRVTGKLLGIAAPKHLKIGHSVRYRQSTIDAWIENLAQYEIDGAQA
ncbi:helix-turn-helix transcriptional regulator [Glaciecola petra]|uniref:Helix-turn-helix domain-containing protein n=1 Tax=Glaciecola petra TaxID=3075602 RepID=A0ABU2ZPI6_9ALTE|nr:helix-turn-helix domain-containing protein [Aestuariibacter sp. P117]MDT0594543.1 helix-turn-helix domain-containing protein [Aestuariibacter sp. P117]